MPPRSWSRRLVACGVGSVRLPRVRPWTRQFAGSGPGAPEVTPGCRQAKADVPGEGGPAGVGRLTDTSSCSPGTKDQRADSMVHLECHESAGTRMGNRPAAPGLNALPGLCCRTD